MQFTLSYNNMFFLSYTKSRVDSPLLKSTTMLGNTCLTYNPKLLCYVSDHFQAERLQKNTSVMDNL